MKSKTYADSAEQKQKVCVESKVREHEAAFVFEPARFPPDFISAVMDGAESVLYDYLKERTPKLRELFDAYACLSQYKADAQAGQTTPMMNANAADFLSQVTCILAELRFSFKSQREGEECTPHLDWLDWHKADSETVRRCGDAKRIQVASR